jgi:hypothetical protein
MAWQPVFSPDGAHVAAKVEKNGRFTILLNGRPIDMTFADAWQPVFSPDSRKLLVRAVLPQGQGGHYCRIVLNVDSPALSERRPGHA